MKPRRTPVDIGLMKVSLLLGLGVLSVLLARAYLAGGSTDLDAVLQREGLSWDAASGFQVVDDRRDEGRGVRWLTASRGDDRVAIKFVDVQDAAAAAGYVDDQRVMIESLFHDRQAPYPGQLSTTLQCPDELKPVRGDTAGDPLLGLLYGLRANDRFAYGGCSEDLLTHHAALALFFCEERHQMVKVEYFTPVAGGGGEPMEKVRHFRCAESGTR